MDPLVPKKEEIIETNVGETKVSSWANENIVPKWGSSYAPKDYETSTGYSSNSISKG